MVGAVMLVVCKDGKQQWPSCIHVSTIRGIELRMSLITPTTILSIAHSIIAFLISLAVKDSIAMTWWRKPLLGGTVKRLGMKYLITQRALLPYSQTKTTNLERVSKVYFSLGRKSTSPPSPPSVLRHADATHKAADHLLELGGDRKVKCVPVEREVGEDGVVKKIEIMDVASPMATQVAAESRRARWVGGCEPC